jgi:HEAT repeat protein
MRRLLPLLVVLCAVLPAHAAPAACQAWKKRQKTVDKQESAWWDNYRDRLDGMYAAWRSQWSLWRGDPDAYKDEVEDLTVLRELYAEYAGIQDARAEIDLDLAKSGVEEASKLLLDELLDVVKAQGKLEDELAESRPTLLGDYYDQAPAIRLHGGVARVRGLVHALAACPGAVAFLGGEGLTKADRADKRGAFARRAAVLDALGATGADEARPVLESLLAAEEPAVRILAVDNLVPFGGAAVDALKPLLEDPSAAVRRALLEQIARDAPGVAAWIPPVMAVYEQQPGLVRARALEALVALTGLRAFGDDASKWKAWFERARVGIENGTWQRPEPKPRPEGEQPDVEAEDDARAPAPAAAVTFYGVGAPSRQVLFVLDGSTDLRLPAELALQQEKARRTWLRQIGQWKGLHPDHQAVMLEQLATTLGAMPEDARFAVVYLTGGNPERVPQYGDRKPLAPSKNANRKLLKAIAKPEPNGTMSAEEGLRRALGLCGSEPCSDPGPKDICLDTIFLLHTGWVGGRWGIPEALVADFERRNRFHRLQVNAIRIGDRKAEAQALMKGLADASGGTYLWLQQLP